MLDDPANLGRGKARISGLNDTGEIHGTDIHV